jgi:hypothetical protein
MERNDKCVHVHTMLVECTQAMKAVSVCLLWYSTGACVAPLPHDGYR